MALGAADLLVVEERLAALGRRAELAVDQVRAGHRLERLEVLVDGHGLLLGPHGEQDVRDARAHGRLGRRPRTPSDIDGGVWWASSMLLVFFGLPRPSFIRSQFRRVDAGVGVATRAALPVLEAEVGVVEEHLAAALDGQLGLRAQGDRLVTGLPAWLAGRPRPACR